MRVLLMTGALVPIGFFGLYLLLSRTLEFRAQARRGQPIVLAIEDFKKQTGAYPTSLADLVPQYLSDIPDTPDKSTRKFRGWDYQTVTNGLIVSYSLRYFMGRGGVEYEPPAWFGNDEGHRTVILRND